MAQVHKTKSTTAEVRRMEMEWPSRYAAGESTLQIGAAYGVHAATVQRSLNRMGVELRIPKPTFDAATVADWIRRYNAGESMTVIAKDAGTTQPTISKYLRRAGVEIRPPGSGPSAETAERWEEMYRSGYSLAMIAKECGVSNETVRKSLIERGVNTSKRLPVPDAETQSQWVELYRAGFSTPWIADKFDTDNATVAKYLKLCGVKMRLPGGGTNDAEMVADIIERYQNRESVLSIGDDYGISQAGIRNVLYRHGIEPSQRESYQSSVTPNQLAGQDRARQAVRRAIENGDLIRPEHCDKCGKRKKIGAHHDNYRKEREVQWFCDSCHQRWHVQYDAIQVDP